MAGMKHETKSVPDGRAPVDSELLGRPYDPPALFIAEEVELGGGYHTMWVVQGITEESGWSEPYKKSSEVQYRRRVVRVPYPPTVSGTENGSGERR